MTKTGIFMLIFVGSVLISSLSQVLLKKSANRSYSSIWKEYLNPSVIIAYGMFFASTLLTVFAYKNVPLSFGPVLESAGYVFVAILSYLFLKEKLKKKQMIGMVLILLGIAIVSLGGTYA